MQTVLFPDLDKKISLKANGIANKLNNSDRAFHDWYRFVLSFPPHLVRQYFEKFNLGNKNTILDPFCGTGTTLVEAKRNGISSIGIEANPMAYFASGVKVNWNIRADELLKHAKIVAEATRSHNKLHGTNSLRSLPPDAFKLLLKDSISPLPLHKSLLLLEQIKTHKDNQFYQHELLALAKVLVFTISNLYFGPEVGVRRSKKQDALVIESWLDEVHRMSEDIRSTEMNDTPAKVYRADSRQLDQILTFQSIDAVFTSPPYPNEKDYTRTTRLESVVLGFINNREELQLLKKNLLRSNTRNVYKGDDDDVWISKHRNILGIAEEIEERRIALGKTSGFERLYSKVTKLYFGGMARHLAELRPFLKPGARLGYVVGDQASYLQVMIRTGNLLAEIAESLGYKILGIDLFRTRFATVTKQQMREEVLVLQWPGKSN